MPDTLIYGDTALDRHVAEITGETERKWSAMEVAEAMFTAAGHATRIAKAVTVPFNPPVENLRYYLLVYARCTREPILRHWLPACRETARKAIRQYRGLLARGEVRPARIGELVGSAAA